MGTISKNPNNSYNFGMMLDSGDHATKVLKLAKLHLDNTELCDVELISDIDGQHVQAHRLILSANSAMFSKMFTSSMREANSSQVHLGEMQGDTLRSLVNFCYTGKIDVNAENVEALFTAANRLLMSSVLMICENFMASEVHASNCLGIAFIAERHNCKTLYDFARKYCNRHFMSVSQSPEFLELNADQLDMLLSSNDLVVPSEEYVFQSLMSWLQHDEPNRKQYIPKLLTQVRLPLLKPAFLADHVQSLCIANNCQKLILDAYQWQLIPERRSFIVRRRTMPNVPYDRLLAIWETEGKVIIEGYCCSLKQWTTVRNLNLPCSVIYEATVVNNKVILVDYETSVSTRLVSFDLGNISKTTYSESILKKSMGLAVLKGLLYTVGGFFKNSLLNGVERWDANLRVWTSVAPMPTKRCNMSFAVINDCLYAVGGMTDKNASANLEMYNPNTNKWRRLSPMLLARASAGVLHSNGLLYAVGGFGIHTTPLTCVESYNPTTDAWMMVYSPAINLGYTISSQFCNRLFAINRDCRFSPFRYIDEYDPELNIWNKVAPMNYQGRRILLIIPSDKTKSLTKSAL